MLRTYMVRTWMIRTWLTIYRREKNTNDFNTILIGGHRMTGRPKTDLRSKTKLSFFLILPFFLFIICSSFFITCIFFPFIFFSCTCSCSISSSSPFLVTCYATLHPFMSVCRSVDWSPFWHFWALLAHSSCPNAPMTFSITAAARPHATWFAVYPALFSQNLGFNLSF